MKNVEKLIEDESVYNWFYGVLFSDGGYCMFNEIADDLDFEDSEENFLKVYAELLFVLENEHGTAFAKAIEKLGYVKKGNY